MKLILKRCGSNTRSFGVDGQLRSISNDRDNRPFALHTEDGEALPQQAKVTMNCEPGEMPTVTVTFYLDGRDVAVQGDSA